MASSDPLDGLNATAAAAAVDEFTSDDADDETVDEKGEDEKAFSPWSFRFRDRQLEDRFLVVCAVQNARPAKYYGWFWSMHKIYFNEIDNPSIN